MGAQISRSSPRGGSRIGGVFGGILRARESGIALPLILLVIVVSAVNPVFLDIDNLLNIARQISFTFIIGIAIALGVLIGVVTGIFNGVVITRFRIPSLIVTLGMMYIARGVVQVLTRGNPVYPFPDEFNNLGQGYLLGVPNVVYVAVVLGVLAHVVLKQTAWGRAVFAVG